MFPGGRAEACVTIGRCLAATRFAGVTRSPALHGLQEFFQLKPGTFPIFVVNANAERSYCPLAAHEVICSFARSITIRGKPCRVDVKPRVASSTDEILIGFEPFGFALGLGAALRALNLYGSVAEHRCVKHETRILAGI